MGFSDKLIGSAVVTSAIGFKNNSGLPSCRIAKPKTGNINFNDIRGFSNTDFEDGKQISNEIGELICSKMSSPIHRSPPPRHRNVDDFRPPYQPNRGSFRSHSPRGGRGNSFFHPKHQQTRRDFGRNNTPYDFHMPRGRGAARYRPSGYWNTHNRPDDMRAVDEQA